MINPINIPILPTFEFTTFSFSEFIGELKDVKKELFTDEIDFVWNLPDVIIELLSILGRPS